MHDLDGQGRLAVQSRVALRVLVRPADFGDVLEVDDAFVDCLDRHVEHVVGTLEDAGHLDREAAFVGLQRTRRDEAIVERNEIDDLRLVEAVTLHGQRVDDDLHQLLTHADQVYLEDPGEALDLFLEVLRDRDQRPFRHVAGQVEHQHRVEPRHLDFVDGGFVRLVRQLPLCHVDFFADVCQCLVGVDAGVKLDEDIRAAFIGVRCHLLDTFDRPQLLLHRPDQEALAVLGGNAVVRDVHVDHRDLDVRLRFLRDRHVRNYARDQDDCQRQQYGPRPRHCRLDELHGSSPRRPT